MLLSPFHYFQFMCDIPIVQILKKQPSLRIQTKKIIFLFKFVFNPWSRPRLGSSINFPFRASYIVHLCVLLNFIVRIMSRNVRFNESKRKILVRIVFVSKDLPYISENIILMSLVQMFNLQFNMDEVHMPYHVPNKR